MLFDQAIFALFYGCLFHMLASAHHQCESCIPLDDLLAEAYGIEVSMERL